MASPADGKSVSSLLFFFFCFFSLLLLFRRRLTPQNSSFVLNKPHDVTYQDRPVPSIAQDPHDVLVAFNYTGICGSDVHYWKHGAPSATLL